MSTFNHSIIFFLIFIALGSTNAQTQKDTIKAYIAAAAPVIDGKADDACWTNANWYSFNKIWYPWGTSLSTTDFSARYKVAWNADFLYIFVETTDNILFDDHPNLFSDYWKGDCVEIFLDENRSKGDHWYTYNAFAYHVGPRGTVVDLGTNHSQIRLDDHVNVKVDTISENHYNWEFAVKIYSDKFNPSSPEASRLKLAPNKVMGFTLAYCDNDGTNQRENFIGSQNMSQSTWDDNYKNANSFGTLLLYDPSYIPQSIAYTENVDFELFPNPTAEQLRVTSGNYLKNIKILSLNGSVLKEIKHINSKQYVVTLKGFSKGMYMIQALGEGNKTLTGKFVVK